MPIPVRDIRDLKLGDYVEDCRYWPCIVREIIPDVPAPGVEPTWGTILVEPLVWVEYYGVPKEANYSGYCGVPHCGIQKLTEDEVVKWIISGPDGNDTDNGGFAWWCRISKKLKDYMAQPDPFAKLVKRNPKAGRKFKAKPREKRGKFDRR